MKKKKIIFSKLLLTPLLISVPYCFLTTSCSSQKVEWNNIKISHNEEYGGINLSLTKQEQTDFCQKFIFGDGINISIFNNGQLVHKEENFAFYNGYYAGVDTLALVSIVNYPLHLTFCSSAIDIWKRWGITDQCLLNVSLNTKAKYIETQQYLDFKVVMDKGNMTDEQWSNFRPLKSAESSGKLKEKLFYRSASPCNNKFNRAATTSKLMEQNKITFDINLSEDKETLDKITTTDRFKEDCPYFYNLYKSSTDDNLTFLAQHIRIGFYSDKFKTAIKSVLQAIIEYGNDKTFLIHCVEGKDRTGIVCGLLQCLTGASYQFMLDDYLTSFKNIYNADFSDTKRLDTVTKVFFITNVLAPICYPNKEKESFLPETYKNITDFTSYGKKYLLEQLGWTETEVNELLKIISNN